MRISLVEAVNEEVTYFEVLLHWDTRIEFREIHHVLHEILTHEIAL